MSACALVDSCVKELLDTCDKMGGRWLLTADHGNADDMVQRQKKSNQPMMGEDGKFLPLTSHTLVRSWQRQPFMPDALCWVEREEPW